MFPEFPDTTMSKERKPTIRTQQSTSLPFLHLLAAEEHPPAPARCVPPPRGYAHHDLHDHVHGVVEHRVVHHAGVEEEAARRGGVGLLARRTRSWQARRDEVVVVVGLHARHGAGHGAYHGPLSSPRHAQETHHGDHVTRGPHGRRHGARGGEAVEGGRRGEGAPLLLTHEEVGVAATGASRWQAEEAAVGGRDARHGHGDDLHGVPPKHHAGCGLEGDHGGAGGHSPQPAPPHMPR